VKCRFCKTELHDLFLDLGSAPPSNAFLSPADLNEAESYFALRLFTCRNCFLVQVDEVQKHEQIFSSDYLYFSSFSRSWLQHAENYVNDVIERLSMDGNSLAMEIASNDGYLLQYLKQHQIPCIGIEPTASTAKVAREKGIETIERFFGLAFAEEFIADNAQPDLIIANNVLAHVPDVNDFVAGLARAISPEGVITIEFPHLLQLVTHGQFDTVYHEHFSYFSLHTVQKIFNAQGLRIWDVEELPTHGGSLRLWACRQTAAHQQTAAVTTLLAKEANAGMLEIDYYLGFQARADAIKNDFLAFLLQCKRDGKKVIGYGAAAKGNTLLNYAGVKPDLMPYVVDASPHKQNRFLPGSHIPVVAESVIRELKPDFIFILPWNLQAEIIQQLAYIRDWGGQFVTAVPALKIQ
jgi:2-polyprenyl-3-methyl-5-hydroxy-6-metoxy-1,4-benzoquinol methylase